MAAPVPTRKLPSGHTMPAIALGVYESAPGAESYDAVLSALKLGYRHIDTATYYANEADVGKAIKDAGLSREEVFITSKYFAMEWNYDEVLDGVKASVEKVGGGYIDLYLLHAPLNPVNRADAWRALEDAQSQGLLRDIGVSNFGVAHLKKLSETWRVKPAVNQLELHPWLSHPDIVEYCNEQGILLQAYSPLARANKMDDPVVAKIAAEVNATPAQVLVAWSLARDFTTLPKSVTPSRQKVNLESYKITLSAAHVATLDALNEDLITAGWGSDPTKTHAV